MGSEPTDLVISNAIRKYYVPYADSENYETSLLAILKAEKPDLVHFQNDLEPTKPYLLFPFGGS
jgi:carbamoyl-phosphate synthase large subunit